MCLFLLFENVGELDNSSYRDIGSGLYFFYEYLLDGDVLFHKLLFIMVEFAHQLYGLDQLLFLHRFHHLGLTHGLISSLTIKYGNYNIMYYQ